MHKSIWKRIWNEHAGWCEEATRSWGGEQRHISKVISSYYIETINWRKVWRKFNKWFETFKALDSFLCVDWIEQQEKIEELVNEQINS